ncbi:hypothetical protein HPB49_020208 [Dermacentor silvarum]|uniref:Uncharacterized protein n=1 Tax=Dermacentor silvarum TaxID=543639 RepID=A0ACB8DKK8_DERSI|nr:hypothetical protein HPB49_020208 [Dermacentor silvarum]
MAWGYRGNKNKVTHLCNYIQDARLTQRKNPVTSSRIGRTTKVDTSPDLTLTKYIGQVTWQDTMTKLGSDHYIVAVTITAKNLRGRSRKPVKITDWENNTQGMR